MEVAEHRVERDFAATSDNQWGAEAIPRGFPVTRQRWTLTGIRVLANQTMNVQASGTIGLSTDPNDEATPAGAKSGRTAPAALVTGAPAGALIGRIGTNGQPFLIGDQTEVTMPATGLLYLSVNDGYLDDNNGEFRVRLWPQ
jgi:hypothetical protein